MGRTFWPVSTSSLETWAWICVPPTITELPVKRLTWRTKLTDVSPEIWQLPVQYLLNHRDQSVPQNNSAVIPLSLLPEWKASTVLYFSHRRNKESLFRRWRQKIRFNFAHKFIFLIRNYAMTDEEAGVGALGPLEGVGVRTQNGYFCEVRRLISRQVTRYIRL